MKSNDFIVAVILISLIIVIYSIFVNTNRISKVLGDGVWQSTPEFEEKSGADHIILVIDKASEEFMKKKHNGILYITTNDTSATGDSKKHIQEPLTIRYRYNFNFNLDPGVFSANVEFDNDVKLWPKTVNISIDVYKKILYIYKGNIVYAKLVR